MTTLPLHGGCLCGAVRYELSAPLGLIEHCHCSRCRKAHGSAFSTNAVVPTSALHISAAEGTLRTYAPSPKRLKCFCGTCGSQLFIRRTDRPDITVITLGTLDSDPLQRPERHVFVGSKAAWYDIDADLPQFKVYPGID